MNIARWILYTVIFGMIPFLLRIAIVIGSKNFDANYCLNVTDIASFGLVVNITNINEIDSRYNNHDIWKTVSNGISVFFILMYAIVLGINGFAEYRKLTDINFDAYKDISLLLGCASLLFGFHVQYKLNLTSNG